MAAKKSTMFALPVSSQRITQTLGQGTREPPGGAKLPGYAELFCQTNFSFLEGASRPEELVRQADFLAYSALAITDECSLAGVVRAHTLIRDQQLDLQLIVGSLMRFESLDVVLLCPDKTAYSELCRVITNARRRAEKGYYQLAEWDLLSLRHCLLIWLPKGDDRDEHWGAWLTRHHAHRSWVGIQRHLVNQEQRFIAHCEALAVRHQLPITACGGVLMHNSERLRLQQTLTAIRLNLPLEQVKGRLLVNAERALRSREKLSKLFKAPWLAESLRIAKRCHFNLDSLRYQYPAELVPSGKTAMQHLRDLVKSGQKARFPQGVPSEIAEIITKELALIEELDYPYFFLTIHDLVRFARSKAILYQGRGSAANSVVCYCLEITAVDPRQVSVLFERFISKERNEPPDIDVDFEHERREEVIQYIYHKYGRKRAALAATVISYRFKSAVRDVGKALGIEATQLDYFIRNVNRRDRGQNWQTQLSELGLQPDSLKGQHFISLVEEIMGFPRHLSQHVGGFVISAGPLHDLVPIENAAMAERTVIQWDKDDLESLKLLKVDVLALGMLSAIRKTFALIAQHTSRQLDLAELTRMGDDPQVYKMLQRADTVGVFQIESRAQMSMLPRLKPACYYDLVIQIAIVRPGPIQGDMVHPFLKRRNGEEAVTYPSEEVKSVLSRTMGVPIFQEQVIKLAMVAAGFSGGEADQLRRAMASWKKSGELMQFKEKLINGMQQRGYEVSFAERIFEQICGFGEYGFPESHSASFAVLAYASAWLKHYYPAMFYTALLNSLPMGFYSASQLIQDARRHQVEVLPVCVNASEYDHYICQQQQRFAIRLGLRLVKGLQRYSAEQLLAARPGKGFQNMAELQRIGLSGNALECLASANALKALQGDRYSARWTLMDQEQTLPLFAIRTEVDGAHSLAESQSCVFQPDDMDDLVEDYAALGLTLGQHPVTLLDKAGKLGRFTRMAQLSACRHKSLVTVIGIVTGKQAPGTAGGVTFFTLEDDTGNINVVVWAGTARAQKQAYLSAKLLEVKGIVEKEGEVIHVIAGRLIDRSEVLGALHSKSRDFH
ncbi:error-prone DNA polymerase [Pseudoalteromonas sp. R3]|uniref:error-prone DNA polymerase n=1 Tax=Pseudoalteromonas sp. R3 TaxID=1709477 RepID=UPI0009EA57C1|nr:error-prone DNA polymerase [Pseudoalteromonas sp. R3]AZZ99056.1 DNA polymerase III subunit alpha [Pseudoalteromonas sp. R3]